MQTVSFSLSTCILSRVIACMRPKISGNVFEKPRMDANRHEGKRIQKRFYSCQFVCIRGSAFLDVLTTTDATREGIQKRLSVHSRFSFLGRA